MAERRNFSFLSADGIHRIHGVTWSRKNDAKGVVQLTHGLGQYILLYDRFARYLNLHGYHVIGHDHLGHGGSVVGPQEYGCFPVKEGWNLVNDDLRQVRERAARLWPGLPHFLLGHSMGSFQARTYLIRYPGTVDGCVLLGTGQEPRAALALGLVLAKSLSRVAGANADADLFSFLGMEKFNLPFRVTRTPADWISRDKIAVKRFLEDPLCRALPTVGMYRDMLEGLMVIGSFDQLLKMDRSTPIALFSGDMDPVGEFGKGVLKVYELLREAGCTDVTMKLYPGARHELLSETNKVEVQEDILAWLNAKVG